MVYLAELNCFQTWISSLEEAINKDNPVRFIDPFVDSLHLTTSTQNKPF